MAWDDNDDGLRAFLAKAGNHRLLSRTEEYETARRARAGDVQAREKLISHNIRLVLSIAQGFRGKGLSNDDLVQEGIIGLHRAVDKFEPERGYRFTTYATWWVRKAIQSGLSSSGSDVIRLPPQVRQRRGRALAYLAQNPNDSMEQVAEALGETVKEVMEALDAAAVVASIHEITSEDQPPALNERYADPNTEDPYDLVGNAPPSAELALALDALEDFDRRVIELRFGIYGDAISVPEIAKHLGRPEHIVQAAQRRALQTLRSGKLVDTR